MAFQDRNGTCGMKLEHSGWNLAEKFETNRDLKWDENSSVFWISMKYWNGIDNLDFLFNLPEK